MLEDVAARAHQDPQGFIGFLQANSADFDDIAQGIIRQLAAAPDHREALARLTRRQERALFFSVAGSNAFTPLCTDCENVELTWQDMQLNDICGTCFQTQNSINRT